MQPQGHIAHLLGRFDLRKFTIKESRRLEDLDTRSSASHKSVRSLELTLALSFECDVLVTNIQVEGKQGLGQLWQVGEIQASSSSTRGSFGSVLRYHHHSHPSQSDSSSFSAVAVTQNLKLTLVLQRPYPQTFVDVLGLKKQRNKACTEQNMARILEHCVRGISACGHYLGVNTSASELVPLLNISQAFKQHKRLDEAAESDILVALSLISARRFVQAAELLRKVSRFYVDKYVTNKSNMELTRIDRSWIREPSAQPSDFSVLTRSFAAGRVLEGGRYLYKAAKVELLLADTINQPILLGQKLQALNRAYSFAAGNVHPEHISARIDYEEAVYTIAPGIMPFLLRVLGDSSQILKVSALKTIEFLYETLGCTLGAFMPQIVTTLCQQYPRLKDSQVRESEGSGTSRSKLVIDHINHLLETLLGLVSSMNKRHLKVLFSQIVGVRGQDCRNQLKLYLLRFSEKILQLCGADLQVSLPYLKYVLGVGEGRLGSGSQSVSKHINHNLVFFAQRILQLLKTRILIHSQKSASIGAICSWMHETLIQLCDNDTISSHNRLGFILDLVIGIYSRNPLPLASPIEPIIYLLNASLAQTKLPFPKILQALVVLLKRAERQSQSEGLAGEMVERILAGAKQCSLGQGQLRVLQGVLSAVMEVRVEWLAQFLACIPHSNHDEVYLIFDRLISGCAKEIDQTLLQQIVSTLFDQYTVKGKAHQHSKDNLVQALLKHQPKALSLLLSICFTNNEEPQLSKYYARNKKAGQAHSFDSKLFKIHSQLYLQKLSLALIVIQQGEILGDKIGHLIRNQGVGQIEASLKKGLASTSFKVKSKMLALAKSLLWAVQALGEQWIEQRIAFGKMMVDAMQGFMGGYRDSKIHYISVLNLGLAMELIPNSKEKVNGVSPSQIRVGELFKVLPSLMNMLQSPWQNIRDITTLTLLNIFRDGLSQPSQAHVPKLKQILKQLLLRCMASQEYSERLMGIRLLALFMGLGKQWLERTDMLKYIQSGWGYFKQFLSMSLQLEEDWHQEVAQTSQMVNSVVANQELRVKMAQRCASDRKNTTHIIENSIFSLPPQDQLSIDPQPHYDTLQHILRADEDFPLEDSFQPPQPTPSIQHSLSSFRTTIESKHYRNINTSPDRDSALEEEYLDPADEQHGDEQQQRSRSQEEPLQIEDVGIVDLDDEQLGWEEGEIGEQEAERLMAQRLPLKKKEKWSPNLGAGSKHPRSRRTKPYNSQFQRDKIIVDEVDGKIVLPSLPNPVRQPPIAPQPPYVEKRQTPQQGWVGERVQPKQEDYSFEQKYQRRYSSDLVVSNLVQSQQPRPAPRKQKKGGRKRKGSTAK